MDPSTGLEAGQHFQDYSADLAGGTERMRRIDKEQGVGGKLVYRGHIQLLRAPLDESDGALCRETIKHWCGIWLNAGDVGRISRKARRRDTQRRGDTTADLKDFRGLLRGDEGKEQVRLDPTVTGLAVFPTGRCMHIRAAKVSRSFRCETSSHERELCFQVCPRKILHGKCTFPRSVVPQGANVRYFRIEVAGENVETEMLARFEHLAQSQLADYF